MGQRLVQYIQSGVHLLGRSVVGVSLSLLLTGCIIGPPDKFEPLEQVPPRVYNYLTVPTPFAYVTTTSTEDQVFHVEFVSEDLGEDVVARLYLNLDTAQESLITSSGVGTGSLDDPPRTANLTWSKKNSAREPAGCYIITMTLAHENNYSLDGALKPDDRSKTAYVSWWVVHNIAPQDLDFDKCPQPGPDLQ